MNHIPQKPLDTVISSVLDRSIPYFLTVSSFQSAMVSISTESVICLDDDHMELEEGELPPSDSELGPDVVTLGDSDSEDVVCIGSTSAARYDRATVGAGSMIR